MSSASIGRCSGCGAWDVDSNSKCLYCGSTVASQQYPFSDKDENLAALSDSVIHWIDVNRANLLKNLAFLKQQLELTQHPSIQQKISNAQVKLDHLDRLGVKLDNLD